MSPVITATSRKATMQTVGFTLFEVLVALFILTSLMMLSFSLWYGSDRARLAAGRDEELLAAYELLLSMWTPVLDGGRMPMPRPDDLSLLSQAAGALDAYLLTIQGNFDGVKNEDVIPCYTLTSSSQRDGVSAFQPRSGFEVVSINDSDYTEDDRYVRFLYRVTMTLEKKTDCEDRKTHHVTLYTTVLIKKRGHR